MVKQQVESQIKVRDLSAARLVIEPADQTSWNDVRTELIAERKAALRSELEVELGAAADESAVEEISQPLRAQGAPHRARCRHRGAHLLGDHRSGLQLPGQVRCWQGRVWEAASCLKKRRRSPHRPIFLRKFG